jgi:hypothetical protein
MIRWLLAVGWRLSVVGDNRNNKTRVMNELQMDG